MISHLWNIYWANIARKCWCYIFLTCLQCQPDIFYTFQTISFRTKLYANKLKIFEKKLQCRISNTTVIPSYSICHKSRIIWNMTMVTYRTIGHLNITHVDLKFNLRSLFRGSLVLFLLGIYYFRGDLIDTLEFCWTTKQVLRVYHLMFFDEH